MSEPTALLVIHDLRPGGAELVYLHYLRTLTAVRPVPVLVRPHGALLSRLPAHTEVYHLESGGERPTRADDRSWREWSGPERESLVRGAVGLLAKAKRLAAPAARERATIVSTFLHKSHAIGLAARALFAPGLRVVVNVHEQPLRHLETHMPPGRRPLARLLLERALPTADRVVAVAPGIAEELRALAALRPERLRVAPNPIHARELRSLAEEPLPPGALPPGSGPVLVGVGRLEAVKGFDVLVDALAMLGSEGPRLVLVGEGSQRGALQHRVEAAGLASRVRFAGHRENPCPWIAAADLMVVPSRTEAWPNVVGEAFALGTPVLATRCSGSVEDFLGGGSRGFLCPPDDALALAGAIRAVLADPERMLEAARHASAYVPRFAPDAMTAHYGSLLVEAA